MQVKQAVDVVRQACGLWWHNWVSLAVLNLCWVVCLTTLVLAPAATFGLHRAARAATSDQWIDFRDLAKTLKQDFLSSWLWLLTVVPVSLLIGLTLLFYSQISAPWAQALRLVTAAVALLWVALQLYLIPYLLEKPSFNLLRAVRNALFTVMASPVYTSILLGFAVLLLYATSRFVFLVFLGVPSLLAVLSTCAVDERLKAFRIRR